MLARVGMAFAVRVPALIRFPSTRGSSSEPNSVAADIEDGCCGNSRQSLLSPSLFRIDCLLVDGGIT